jgi:hypothetical protein
MSKECTTHHFACDCREAQFMRLQQENAELRAALKPLLRHRPDGDVGWRGNTKAKCGWILVSDILRIESALGKEAQP